ncbi:hypothetical protein EDM59_06225 [Brevibacillus nitrificans]|uniref:Uncharacterized protein n=1 Tax=Brevibacillus nitrificans TaxID=651560 RepID=A0A3M8DKS9_9BACL|nr:hypothetical protein EDM59_06225 [Brevibacillus nitrificans]
MISLEEWNVEYICLTCQQIVESRKDLCTHLQQFFASLQGQKIWRIRFLHRYAYEFYSDLQIKDLISEQPLMVSEVMCVEEFDPRTYTGVNTMGKSVSIFE